MTIDKISITKAKVHNLKEVSLEIPKNTFTVITGPSGSGKSSLAFDTIYVEGQRRYIESLSSYARQFLGQYQPPDVESITGLSPAIAIDQKTSSRNPRSTVGTVTEIYDYMRVLFARAGTLYCPESGKEITNHSPTKLGRIISQLENGTKVQLLAPLKISKKNFSTEISNFLSMGFTRCYLDNEVAQLEEGFKFPNTNRLLIVIDRVVIKEDIQKRLIDSIEYGYKLSGGDLYTLIDDQLTFYSENNVSPVTKEIFPSLEPRLFSFNSPIGACPECNGLGQSKVFDKSLMIIDSTLSINDGAITPIAKRNSFLHHMTKDMAKQEGVDLDKPFNKLPKKFLKILFEGSTKSYKYSFKSENSTFNFSKPYPGIMNWLEKKYLETHSEKKRKELEEYMNIKTCPSCKGLRLNRIALSTKISDINIMELSTLPIKEMNEFFKTVELTETQKLISEKLLKEIKDRIKFLNEVGLGYLTLNRSAATLSGGESQRIRLATQIGSALSGVLYVLDEPSIGLHQRDNSKLIDTLCSLRDLGNTVLVVEHDEDTMLAADHIVDMGPGAGIHGGNVVAQGTLKEIIKKNSTSTAAFLSGKEAIEIPKERRASDKSLKLKGVKVNNIDKLDVEIPLGVLCAITGVSGSGKSSLVHEVLVPAIKTKIVKAHSSLYDRTNYQSLTGVQNIQSVIELDQSPIGRTPHSNPATYTGLFTDIRTLFSQTSESKIRGYKPGRFSFNVKGGRCEECEGNGVKKIEMHFLPDVYITCDQCGGSRYNAETLSILYKGRNISDVLKMTIEEALGFFNNHPKMNRILSTLNSVGLGYITLGQSATTLSGGEAQRLKLSRELSKRTKGHCLYVLDEPTTGLHFQDVKVLIEAIQSLVNNNNSVLIIEHNLDVIKTADYIIDLGPEGGDEGGQIVATGTPEEVSKIKNSHTAKFLKKSLK